MHFTSFDILILAAYLIPSTLSLREWIISRDKVFIYIGTILFVLFLVKLPGPWLNDPSQFGSNTFALYHTAKPFVQGACFTLLVVLLVRHSQTEE